MLEANTFRFMMLIGSVILMAAIVTGVFYAPILDVNAEEKELYEDVMNADLADKTTLTAYQAFRFNIKAKLRGGTNHY